MVRAQITQDQVKGLKSLSDFVQFARDHLTADALRQEFENGTLRRKSFCEALDIGESTLSTWLQTERIPPLAAAAYVLWLVVQTLTEEIDQRDQISSEPYVVRFGSTYAVVKPANAANQVDEVIASGIETVALAQEFAVARSHRFREVLDRAVAGLRAYEEQYDDQDNWVSERADALERARDFKVGPATVDELLQL